MGNQELKKLLQIKKASLQQTERGKLILHISLSQFDLDEFCLQHGEQPKGVMKVQIHRSGEF